MSRTSSIIKRLPGFYQSKATDDVLYRFIEVFGKTLDEAESDLIKVMRAHWVDTANNEDSKGFNTTQKGDLDKIFSLYLENLGGTSQLKQIDRRDGEEGKLDDEIYRTRIKGLINVLKSGASTKEGIIDIIAANLGIVGESSAAIAAKNKIRIEEFLPQPFKFDELQLASIDGFTLENPNVIPVTPEIRIQIRSDVPVDFSRLLIVNQSTMQYADYTGLLKSDDVLSLFADGTAFLNGVAVSIDGSTPELSIGESQWTFVLWIPFTEGRYDQTLFDHVFFDSLPPDTDHLTPVRCSYPLVNLNMVVPKYTPGSFKVRIPWDIPGYTEKFDELADNPRNQIKYIVNKVKAAGVFAAIDYEKLFTEEQGLEEYLTVQLPLREEHLAEEANFDIGSIHMPYHGGIQHEMSDALVTTGMFDVTEFDSLNVFG